MLFVFFIVLFVGVQCSNDCNFDLIAQFVNETNSKFCLFLLCWTEFKQISLQKFLHYHLPTRTIFLPFQESLWQIDINSYHEVTFILDFSCPGSREILIQDSILTKFKYNYNWLVICNNTTTENDINVTLSNVSLRLDSRIKIAINNPQDKSYKIFEAYKPGIGVNVQVNLVGMFKDGRFSHLNTMSTYETRKHFKGLLLRTANTNHYSFEKEEDYAKELRSRGSKEFEKFNFQLFLALKYIHNFDYNTTIRHAWFGNDSSGTDAGIGKLLYEKKIDINTSGGLLRAPRVNYFDFLLPYYKFRTSFVFINPGRVKPGAAVLKPFAVTTWYGLFVSGLIVGAAINVAYWLENKYQKTETHSKFSILTILSVYCQQGSSIIPSMLGGRIILLILLMMSMVVYNYFTSSLVSTLISINPETIGTIKELYESKLKLALEHQPYTYTYILQHKEDDVYFNLLNSTKIYENGEPYFLPPSEGIKKIKEGTYAYHTEVPTAYEYLADADQALLCQLADITLIPDGDVGMVMQKNSEYTKMFQISLRKMQTNGIYRREMEFWISKKPACLLNSIVEAVGSDHLFLVYVILLFGLALALLVLCVEILIHKNVCNNLVGRPRDFIN